MILKNQLFHEINLRIIDSNRKLFKNFNRIFTIASIRIVVQPFRSSDDPFCLKFESLRFIVECKRLVFDAFRLVNEPFCLEFESFRFIVECKRLVFDSFLLNIESFSLEFEPFRLEFKPFAVHN